MSSNQAKMGKRSAGSMSLVAMLFAVFIVTMNQAAASEDQNGNRIAGGVQVNHGEFPFLANLVTPGGFHFCGGSVIDKRHILTAAHCLEGESPDEIVVKLGCHEGTNCVGYEIEAFKIHPTYSNFLHYDIAVIRTKKEIIFTGPIGLGAVGPIKLANIVESDYSVGEPLIFAGWGWLDNNRTEPHAPMKIDLFADSLKLCKIAHRLVDESHVCAWSPLGDICRGDSGGPLFKANHANGSFIQIGIVSYGKQGCGGNKSKPGPVFTRVAAYSAWIEKTIQGFEQSSN